MSDKPDKNNGKGPSINEEAMARFCRQFTPELTWTKTDRVGGVRHADAWMTAWWDAKTEAGFTVIVSGGKIHTIIEAFNRTENIEEAGRLIAESFGLTRKGDGHG